METIDCKVIEKNKLKMMLRHMDKLQIQNRQLRRDRAILFFLFVGTAMVLAYVIGQVPV